MAALLQQEFPFVDQVTIQNVINNDCGGDINKARPILSKVNEFNKSMNQSSPQQIPLNANEGTATRVGQPQQQVVQTVQVVQVLQPAPMQTVVMNNNASIINLQNVAAKYPHWNLNLGPSANPCHRSCDAPSCPCCVSCCPSCYLIPDKYDKGLYNMDLTVKNVAFMLFVAMSIYGEASMKILDSAYHGAYLPTVGLVFIGIASLLFWTSRDHKVDSMMNKTIAVLYFLGGLLYLIGYFIYTASLDNYNVCAEGGTVCDCDYYYGYRSSYYWDDFCWCEQNQSYGDDVCERNWYWTSWSDGQYDFRVYKPYYAARGIFIFYHCLLMAVHYISKETKCVKDRLLFIRLDSFMWGLVYCGIICSLSIPDWIWVFALSGCVHFFAGIIALVNMCIAAPNTNAGGCNPFTVTGVFLLLFYITEVILLLSFLLDFTIHEDIIITPNIIGMPFFFWAMGLIVFGTLNWWILLRAMHPAFTACLCKKIQRDLVEVEI